MKKIRFSFLAFPVIAGVSCLFLLTACGNPSNLTHSEMETRYQTQLQTLTSQITSLMALPISEAVHTDTTLTVTAKNNVKGHLTYTSSQDSQGTDEETTHTVDFALQNLSGTEVIVLSGKVNTLYLAQLMYFNIQDFNLFLGTGNAEASFINLLARDLSHKRVALDKNEKIGLSIVETPSLSAFLADLIQLYTLEETTITSTETELPPSENLLPLAQLSDAHLLAAQHITSFLADLLNISLTTNGLVQDTSAQSTLTYTPQNKDTILLTKDIHYRTDTHTFTLQLTLTPTQLIFTLTDIVDLSDPETPLLDTYTFTLTPKKTNIITLEATHFQADQEQWDINADLTFEKTDTTLNIGFQGDGYLTTQKFSADDKLHMDFKGTQTFQPASPRDFILTGETIKLSDLL